MDVYKNFQTEGVATTSTHVEPHDCHPRPACWRKSDCYRRNKRRIKVAVVLSMLGLLMIVMGSIIHVEKSAIRDENKKSGIMANTNYTSIAGNVLLILGTTFTVCSIVQAVCCWVEPCCPEKEEQMPTVTTNTDTRVYSDSSNFAISQAYVNSNDGFNRSDSGVFTISVAFDDLPNYHEATKTDLPPPCYSDVIDELVVCSKTNNNLQAS